MKRKLVMTGFICTIIAFAFTRSLFAMNLEINSHSLSILTEARDTYYFYFFGDDETESNHGESYEHARFLSKHQKSPFLPANLYAPRGVTMNINDLFQAESELASSEKSFKLLFQIISIYWEGYIAFLATILTDSNDFHRFKITVLDKHDTPTYRKIVNDIYAGAASSSPFRWKDLFDSILTHYTLGFLFNPHPEITVDMRQKAWMLWKENNPTLSISADQRYRYAGLLGERTWNQLLPSTFAPFHYTSPISYFDFFNNKILIHLFGRKFPNKAFSAGLDQLLESFPAEFIQVCHSFLRVDAMHLEPSFYSRKTLFALDKLMTSLDHVKRNKVFSANASFRNGGYVSHEFSRFETVHRKEFFSESPRAMHFSRQVAGLTQLNMLIGTFVNPESIPYGDDMRFLRIESPNSPRNFDAMVEDCKRLQKRADTFEQREQALTVYALIASHDPCIHPMLPFFKISPFISWQENLDDINLRFEELKTRFNPDRVPLDKKVEAEEMMKKLIETKEILSNESLYHKFFEECFEKAQELIKRGK